MGGGRGSFGITQTHMDSFGFTCVLKEREKLSPQKGKGKAPRHRSYLDLTRQRHCANETKRFPGWTPPQPPMYASQMHMTPTLPPAGAGGNVTWPRDHISSYRMQTLAWHEKGLASKFWSKTKAHDAELEQLHSNQSGTPFGRHGQGTRLQAYNFGPLLVGIHARYEVGRSTLTRAYAQFQSLCCLM